MNKESLTVLPGVMLTLLCLPLGASEYVPPPTGPYQSSSVIISSGEANSAQPGQVYKFPPADLIPPLSGSDTPTKGSLTDSADHVKRDVMEPYNPDTSATDYAIPKSQNESAMMPQSWPNQPVYGQNPWAYSNQPGYVNPGYSGAWGQQTYPYYQQYPYGASTPYTNSNNPFSNMPSPWSSMPMQPFFSGNKR